jgi:hypothetical protein
VETLKRAEVAECCFLNGAECCFLNGAECSLNDAECSLNDAECSLNDAVFFRWFIFVDAVASSHPSWRPWSALKRPNVIP